MDHSSRADENRQTHRQAAYRSAVSAAVDVFERAKALRIEASDLVFHGSKRGKPLSDMTLLKVLRDLRPYTVHGFRSAFRDWVAEQTSFAGEVAEAAWRTLSRTVLRLLTGARTFWKSAANS